MNEYYSVEQLVNYQKKGKGKLPIFRGNVERVIPIYAIKYWDRLMEIFFIALSK